MKNNTLLFVLLLSSVTIFAQNSLVEGINQRKTGDLTNITRSAESLAVVITSLNKYIPGTTMDIQFTLDLTTPDLEYGDSLWMEFPAGITVVDGSDPFAVATEGQDDESLNTPIVSPFISWGDNDNSYGGIEPGVHNFYVKITIPSSFTGPISINWYMSGDEYGTAPNFTSGMATVVQIPSTPDIMIVAELDNKYHQYPSSLARMMTYSAEIFNNGADLTTPANGVVSFIGTPGSTTTAVSVPFASGATQTLSWPNGVLIDDVGVHNMLFEVDNTNDFNPLDNKDTITINVSDSIYSYTEESLAPNPFGIGDGADGILGSIFDFDTATVLTSISCYIPTVDPTANISFVVYETDVNGPTMVKVFESDTFSTMAASNYARSCNLSFAAGTRYLIGVREQMTGNMSLGSSTYGYHDNSHYAFFQGAWMEVGGAGFPFSFAIFANFSNSCSANFSYAIDPSDPLKVEFSNSSNLAGATGVTYSWDFGDGIGTSNVENPIYTYTSEGVFTACLVISDGGTCSSNTCVDVTVNDGINGVAEIPEHLVKIYPNPSNGEVKMTYSKNANVSVYGIDGSLIKSIYTQPGVVDLDLSGLPNGTYLIKVESEDGVSVKRVSIMK